MFWGFGQKNLTASDKIYSKPGTLLQYLGWNGMRIGILPIQFIGRNGYKYPNKGDILMVVSPPVIIDNFIKKYTKTGKAVFNRQITVQFLLKEEIVFAEWDYTTYGFSAFFDLKYAV